LFWTVGLVIALRRGNVARSLLVGSGLFSLTQFFPIAQMVSGMIALGAWQWVTKCPDDGGSLGKIDTVPAGFVVTTLTGMPLMLIAVAGGYCVRRLVGFMRRRKLN
jgi:hypothetical protein